MINIENNKIKLRRIAINLLGMDNIIILKDQAKIKKINYEETILEVLKELISSISIVSQGENDILSSSVEDIVDIIEPLDFIEIFESYFELNKPLKAI